MTYKMEKPNKLNYERPIGQQNELVYSYYTQLAPKRRIACKAPTCQNVGQYVTEVILVCLLAGGLLLTIAAMILTFSYQQRSYAELMLLREQLKEQLEGIYMTRARIDNAEREFESFHPTKGNIFYQKCLISKK